MSPPERRAGSAHPPPPRRPAVPRPSQAPPGRSSQQPAPAPGRDGRRGPPRSDGLPPSLSKRSGRDRSGPTQGPPVLPFVASLVMLLVAGALMWLGGELVPCQRATTCEPVANAAGFVSGSLLGIVWFGAFMALDNRRRASKRYRDWRISPRRLIPLISVAAWALGMVHMFGFALHLTRLL